MINLNQNQLLYQMSCAFQKSLENMDESLRVNMNLLIQALHFDRAVVYLLDEKESILWPQKIVTAHGEMEGNGESFISMDKENNFSIALSRGKEVVSRVSTESGVYLPLVWNDRKLGVLRVDNFFSNQDIKSEQVANLKSFAEIFSLGINNALNYQHFKHQVNKLTTLTKIGNAITTTFKLDEILELALSSLVNDLGYDRAQAFLLDEGSDTITENLSIDLRGYFRSIDNATNISPLVGTLFSKNKPSIVARKFSSNLIAYIPINWKDKRTGLLVVDNLFSRQKLTPYDLSFLSIMADQLATVIENSRLFERVEKLSITDSLTGLFNHRYFYERLSEEISRANRFGNRLALLMLDIDYFKNFNDTYGHQAGDTVLKSVTQIIQENIRSIDIASRYGGEELTVILPETDLEGAKTIAERIRMGIANQSFKIGNQSTHITVSIGLVCYPTDATLKSELVRKADLALYSAKNQGRNRVCTCLQ